MSSLETTLATGTTTGTTETEIAATKIIENESLQIFSFSGKPSN